MKNIKAISFDAYGTLFDVNSAAEKCKDKIGDKWEGFANYWRTTQLEYTWLRSLMNRHKDFWQVTEDSLDKSMKAFNIDPSMKDELLNLYKVLSPFKEVPEVLKTLKEKNFKLAILSNGTPDLLKELANSFNRSGVPLDRIANLKFFSLRVFKTSGTSLKGERTLYKFNNSSFIEGSILKAFIDLSKLSSVTCQKSLCLFIKLRSQVYSNCVVLQ